jgi:hypothetical protein
MGDRRSPDQRRLEDAALKRRLRQDKARRISTRDAGRTTMSDTHDAEHHEEPKVEDEKVEAQADEADEHEEAEEAQAADKD